MRIRTQPLGHCTYRVHSVGSLYDCTRFAISLGRIGLLCARAAFVSHAGLWDGVGLGSCLRVLVWRLRVGAVRAGSACLFGLAGACLFGLCGIVVLVCLVCPPTPPKTTPPRHTPPHPPNLGHPSPLRLYGLTPPTLPPHPPKTGCCNSSSSSASSSSENTSNSNSSRPRRWQKQQQQQ
jgi:hypothetical protein